MTTLSDLRALGVKCGRAGILHPKHGSGFTRPLTPRQCRDAATVAEAAEQAMQELHVTRLDGPPAVFIDGLCEGLRERGAGRGTPWA